MRWNHGFPALLGAALLGASVLTTAAHAQWGGGGGSGGVGGSPAPSTPGYSAEPAAPGTGYGVDSHDASARGPPEPGRTTPASYGEYDRTGRASDIGNEALDALRAPGAGGNEDGTKSGTPASEHAPGSDHGTRWRAPAASATTGKIRQRARCARFFADE